MASHLIGSTEAARILGIDRSSLTRRARAGRVPVVGKLDGLRGALVFDRAVIEQLAGDAS